MRDVSACLRFYCFFSFVVEFSGDFVVYICLPDNGMGDKTKDQQRDLARKLVNLFREWVSAEEWPAILGAVAKVLAAYPTPPPPPDVRDPG